LADAQADFDSIEAEVDEWLELRDKELDYERWEEYHAGLRGA